MTSVRFPRADMSTGCPFTFRCSYLGLTYLKPDSFVELSHVLWSNLGMRLHGHMTVHLGMRAWRSMMGMQSAGRRWRS